LTTPAKVIAPARADLGMREDPSGSDVTPITRAFGKITGYPSGGLFLRHRRCRPSKQKGAPASGGGFSSFQLRT
jgi:hypothetical protein